MDNLFVDGLSKSFRLGRPAEENPFNPKQWLRTVRRRAFSGSADTAEPESREFWALKDVSFRVQPGTVLGVIGPNGAGKSTLLKIIARVLTPTSGRIVGVGRLISLLELGAGFDPDMTARENVVMNAAMNGISKAEALRRLDSIIEFAETRDFLDTELKFYSSGMHLRLAFSCAINMDPQILLADEVLAVGDLAFQERCLQRVKDEAARGLTVLFVSHDMEAIARVCTRVLWLQGGRVRREGEPEEVVDEYQNATWEAADSASSEKGRHVNRFGRLIGATLVSQAGKEVGAVRVDEKCAVRIAFETFINLTLAHCDMDLYVGNVWVLRAHGGDKSRRIETGQYYVYFRLPAHFLSQTTYTMSVSITVQRKNDDREYTLVMYRALRFMAYTGDSEAVRPAKRAALLAPKLSWDIEQVARSEAPAAEAPAAEASAAEAPPAES